MPTMKRNKTAYKGVWFITGTDMNTGKPERIYYIGYRNLEGRWIEEKAGRSGKNAMTPSRASAIRAAKIKGEPSNAERREMERMEREAKAGRWTIMKLWDDYKTHRYSGPPPTTEKCNFKNYLSPAFGNKTPHEISTLDVERLKSSLAKAGKKPGTIAKIIELLRRLINHGTNREYYLAPAVRVKLPRVPLDREPEFLNDKELARLIEVLGAYGDTDVANLVRLALLTGMRRSELFRLEWNDMDLERGFLRIRHPKGGTEESIPLSDAARAVLASQHRTRSPLVFPGRGGRMRADVNRHAKAIRESAKLPTAFRLFHGARHHFASHLVSSGVDLYTVGRLLTHKSPSMTKRYSHLSDTALRKAVNIAAEIVSTPDPTAKEEAMTARKETA